MGIYKCKDLEVYQLSFDSAVEIFKVTRSFPKEERYSLIDQIRRSSRSVSANIREGFAKRRYKDVFLRHLNDALGSSEETMTWLDFSFSSSYIDEASYEGLLSRYRRIGAMLYGLIKKWQDF